MSTTIPSYKEGLKGLIAQLGEMLPEDKLAVFNNDAKELAAAHTNPLKLEKGDKAPRFLLTNAKGETVSLEKILEKGPVVLTFYRGMWCPYCNLELKTYQQILPQIKDAGANLIAISPMNRDNSLSMKQTNELEFEVLSDIGNTVARQYTTVFQNPNSSIEAMAELGFDFYSFYDDKTADLPVPGVFVIDKDSTILLASSAGGDYRERTEPKDILDALNTVKKTTV